MNQKPPLHDSFTPRQAAEYIGMSDSTLRGWRAKGKGPRFYRVSERLIRYRVKDVDAWIEARMSDQPNNKVKPRKTA